jgi:hypothetical protein
MIRDNLHYTFRTNDGYNKAFNFVISEREPGKTTAMWLDKAYKAFSEKGMPSLIIKRQIVDITEVFIHDIEEILNKFLLEPVSLSYKRQSLKDGIVDVLIKEKLFVRIIALSNPISRVKSLIIRNLAYILFDEFICNTKFGEKYLKNEAFKFKEIFNTFQREAENLKCYFLGNPYSLYNPYFVWLGVDTKKLKPGAIISGSTYVIECYEMKVELRKLILERNPLYQFDDSYKRYAFDGLNVNDANIRLGSLPESFTLRFLFHTQDKTVAVYKATDTINDIRFYCELIDENTISKRRNIYCFDFEDIVNKVILMSRQDRIMFDNFRRSIQLNRVIYNSIEVYYLTEEVYENL